MRSIRKAPVRCPKCQFVQFEPAHALSTFCRACGEHFSISREGSGGQSSEIRSRASFVNRAVRKIISRPPRTVDCYHCGESHIVSGHSLNTLCPGCGRAIDLEDMVVVGMAPVAINTRGLLHVTAKGNLSNESIFCGDALIEGRLAGTLRAAGTIRLACNAKMNCKITASSIQILKGANIEMAHPVETNELIVQGKLTAPVICHGRVHVKRGGAIEGTVRARAMSVDRGGLLIGDSVVRHDKPAAQPAIGNQTEDFPLPGESGFSTAVSAMAFCYSAGGCPTLAGT